MDQRRMHALRLGTIAVALGMVMIDAASRPTSHAQPSPSKPPPRAVAAPTPTPAATPNPSERLALAALRPRADAMGRLDSAPRSELRAGTADRSTLAITATYDADVDLAVRSGALRVQATIVARNDDPEAIDRIELNTAAIPLAGMTLESATVDGNPVSPTLSSQTIVMPLGALLPSGATVRLTVGYHATVGNRLTGPRWLFSRAEGYVALYRWLPWISRDVPWSTKAGDPFVTVTSPNVRVRLRTDRAVTVGASGPQVAGDKQPGRDMTFEASNVRDFNLALSESYRVSTRDVDGVAVRVLTRGSLNVARVHELAKEALTRFGANLGAYPWPELTIAEVAAPIGMESPALVWIPRVGTSSPRIDVIPHEIAHQWFYAIVGNDQTSDPFADEAFASFMSRDLMGLLRSPRCAFDTADRSIYEYTDPCYYETIYIRGGLLFDSIRDDIGNSTFWGAVRGYAEEHWFGMGSTAELFDALRAASPLNLRPRIEALLPSLY
jgi:hypothetical protein